MVRGLRTAMQRGLATAVAIFLFPAFAGPLRAEPAIQSLWEVAMERLLATAEIEVVTCDPELRASVIKAPTDEVVCGRIEAAFEPFKTRWDEAVKEWSSSAYDVREATPWEADRGLQTRLYKTTHGVFGVMFEQGNVALIKASQEPRVLASCPEGYFSEESMEVIGEGQGGGRRPLREGPGVVLPEVTDPVEPEYPEAARRSGLDGEVALFGILTRDGRIRDLCVQGSSAPSLGFEEAAAAAVQQYRFSPGMRDGVPIEVTYWIAVAFTIDQAP